MTGKMRCKRITGMMEVKWIGWICTVDGKHHISDMCTGQSQKWTTEARGTKIHR